MYLRKKISFFFFIGLVSLVSFSCNNKRIKQAQSIVINEIMASNRTGLLTEDGNPADWIELKNMSNDTINLKGFKLTVIKKKEDPKGKDKMTEEEQSWEFPNIDIGAGECLIVFAEKSKKKRESDVKESEDHDENLNDEDKVTPKELIADITLPKAGAVLQFQAPDGKMIKEVEYGKLEADQSWSLRADSTYSSTFWQSPGFENNDLGYIAANKKIDSLRNSPLKIWELNSREKIEPNSREKEKKKYNWIELKNVSNKEIDLSEYSLSKKVGDKNSWNLPKKILKPGEIVSFSFVGKKAGQNNRSRIPFKLGDAETVVLTRNGKFVDGMNAKPTIGGTSIGRSKAETGFFFFTKPTKEEENGKEKKRLIADQPVFDMKAGLYPDNECLTLKVINKNQKVRFTLNGSSPSSESNTLKDSILIKKSTVVRAYAEGDSLRMRSKVSTSTYLLGVEHDIPVVNISVNNGDLTNHNTGLLVKGPGYTEDWPHKGANYWQKFTKKAHLEFFDDKEGFATDCGLMVFGGFSRALPKKSFRLKFRNEYGKASVDYDFFGNGNPFELEDLILRSGSQDYDRCMLRDEFFTSLQKEFSPNILTQIYRPIALYINAEYYGLYYIREKIDKNFVSRHLNIPNDSINIIMSIGYNEEGTKDAYQDLMKYVSSHDLSKKENYEYIKKNVDLIGLIDYKLGEMYSGNSDVGNIRYVRSTHPKSDKKWHFVFYDLDATWVGNKPEVAFYLDSDSDSDRSKHNKLISKLLKNNEFRQLFLVRLAYHMKNTYSPQNAKRVFDNLVNLIRPEMMKNCKRWDDLSYEDWEKNIKSFRARFDEKPKVMLEDIKTYLKTSPEENKKYFSGLY